MTINLSLKSVGILAGVLAILAGTSVAYFHFKKPDPVNMAQYSPAAEMRETVKIKRIEVPVERIITIEKEKVVEKLRLSDDIAKDPDKQIIATTKVPAYEGDTDVVAIVDTKTGEGSMVVKQEPVPLFAFQNKKELGGRFGYVAGESGLKQQVDFYGRWTIFRVGRVHVGLYGEINSKPEGKTAVDVSYRW